MIEMPLSPPLNRPADESVSKTREALEHVLRGGLLVGLLPLVLMLEGCSQSTGDSMAQAKSAIAARDAGAASIHLKNLLSKEPNNGEARILLGQTLLTNGDPGGAVIEFKRARELKVDDNRVVPPLAQALLQSGSERLLLDQLGSVQLTLPEAAAQLAITISGAHLAMKRPEKARELIEAALKAAPNSAPTRLAMARLLTIEGKAVDAMAAVTALLADSPTLDEAWAFKGVLHDSAGETDKAFAAYKRALEINPIQAEALYSTALIHMFRGELKAAREIHSRLVKAWPRNPNGLYLEGRIKHLEGKYSLARTDFATLLNLVPENVPTLIASGANELKLGAPIQAEAQLARAVSLSPQESSARFYLAQSQLQLGRPDKATATLAPLLERGEASPSVLVIAAQAKLLQGDAGGADQLFNRAAKLQPKDPGVRTALAAARMNRQQDADGAFRELQQISETNDSTEADFRIVSARLARQEGAEALKAIARLETKTPASAAVSELRGQALRLLNDPVGARKAFEEALGRDKAYGPALGQLTALDLLDGKPDKARDRLKAILAVDRDNSQVLTMLAALTIRMAGSPAEALEMIERATRSDPLNANAWTALLMRHFQAGDIPAALLASQSATKAIPENVQLMDLTGRIEMAAGNQNQAKGTYASIISVAPRAPAGYVGLAMTLVASGDLEAADKVIQRLIAIQPASIDAQRIAADIAMSRNKFSDALSIARNLQRQHPKFAVGHVLEAQAEAAQGRPQAAIAALRQAVNKQDTGPTPVLLHQTLIRQRDTDGAQAFANEWIKRQPKDMQFVAYLGDVELDAKNTEAAAALYAKVLAAEPDHVGALNNAAMALLGRNDEKALEYALRAAGLQPNRPEVLDTLARVHLSRKEYPKAIEALRRGIGRSTNPGQLQLFLAQALIASGDTSSATTELQALVDRGKTHPQYARARTLLAEVRRR